MKDVFKMAKVYVTKDLILICKKYASCPAIEGKNEKERRKENSSLHQGSKIRETGWGGGRPQWW